MKHLSKTHPIQVVIGFTLLVLLIRVTDVFIIRSDELFGEQVLTKVVGLVLILAYALTVKGSLRGLGLHAHGWKQSVLLGLGMMSLALMVGYGAEWLFLFFTKQSPAFYFAPEGNTLLPNDTATGGLLFAFTLITGNVVNSLMEEGFFRGILISHFGSRMNLTKANFIQSAVFGVWHIVWPLRDYLDGKTDIATMIGISIGYILLSGVIGFAWGVYYIKTNSLWTSFAAHTLNNTAMNFLHITTAAGIPSTLGLRVAASTLTVLAILPMFRKRAQALQFPAFETWNDRSLNP
jgi:membrane protease YdiL (CAAX protease family)